MKKITFATNTSSNTVEYTKLLLKSLKENLDSDQHEILVFVDSDNDGTVDYLKSIKADFNDLKIVTHKIKPIVGPDININLIAELATHDVVSYLQSDMVVSSNYDTQVLSDLEENCILSSTRIEPPLHGFSDKTFTMNFGLTPEEFQWDQFLEFSESIKSEKIIEYFFAPFSFYKTTWQKLGGFDSIFRRSRGDSDLVQRCLHANIKLKQSFKSNVYHFTCVSSRGKNWYNRNNEEAQTRVKLQENADGVEIRKFIRKWGSFNHGESKLHKYDMDLVLGGDIQNKQSLVYSIEPFFSRVWFSNQRDRDTVMKLNDNEHIFANQLFNFTDQDWEESKKYYNQTDYESIYRVGKPSDWNILVELDLNNIDPRKDELIQNLSNLYEMIRDLDPDSYELGNSKITIKKIVDLSQRNQEVINPRIDRTLLIIE